VNDLAAFSQSIKQSMNQKHFVRRHLTTLTEPYNTAIKHLKQYLNITLTSNTVI